MLIILDFRAKHIAPRILNINVQKHVKCNEDTETCYNYKVEEKEENRSRTLEDYQSAKLKKMPKTAAEIKLKLRPNKINKAKSQKDIRNFMESQSKKRKLKERMEYLKAKRDNLKIRNQLEKLNNFTSNSSKQRISDKSYNGAVPYHISKKLNSKRAAIEVRVLSP